MLCRVSRLRLTGINDEKGENFMTIKVDLGGVACNKGGEVSGQYNDEAIEESVGSD